MSYVLLEFSRRPRALKELDCRKATEFRQFLLYTGPIILNGIVNTTIYYNFLLLFVGILILSNPRLAVDHMEYANELLFCFLLQNIFGNFMGKSTFLTMSITSYTWHKMLNTIECWLISVKPANLTRLVRKPQLPLSQIVRRLSETPLRNTKKNPKRFQLKKPVPESVQVFQIAQFSEVKTSRFTIKLDQANRFVSSWGSVMIVKNIISCRGETYIVFAKLTNQG